MKTASRVLGSAFFREGFVVQDAPRYGAERRGAPNFAYVRASRNPINERGIIRRPDLVVVADDSLVSVPAAGVLQGLDEHTVLVMNSHDAPELWKDRLHLASSVLILPVSGEVHDRADLPYAGIACAAAAARLVGVIGRQALYEALRDELGRLKSAFVQKNVDTALSTYDLMSSFAGSVTEGGQTSPDCCEKPGWITMPFEDADSAAPSIHAAATSVEVNTGLWRTMRPVVDHERCARCWWVCSTFCPDGAIAVTKEGAPEIDYDHCKGCLICVAKCPPHAIEAIPEHQAQAEEKFGA